MKIIRRGVAVDWIPICKELPRKIEVIAIAEATGKGRREVVGILIEFWGWADVETTDGKLPGLKLAQLPLIIEGTDETFWRAVVTAGWLSERSDGLIIPHFDYWMGQSAKRGLQNRKRKETSR